MRVILFGATGMVGQGVLRECLRDSGVTKVLAVGRRPSGVTHAKLADVVMPDLFDWSGTADTLNGCDACFFCLGTSAAGMREADYVRTTYDLTLAAATALAPRNPQLVFTYVSGAGTDSTEQGRSMWARVKGRTENALLRLPFRAAYMLRPGLIQPVDGVQSGTALYRAVYVVLAPVMPVLRRLLPNQIVTTAELGRIMLQLVRSGYPKRVLETRDLRAVFSSIGTR